MVHMLVGFLVGIQISTVPGFQFRFRLADQGDPSQHLVGACQRLGNRSWPDLSTCMVHMVVGILADIRISGIPGFQFRFLLADQGGHSQHPSDAFGRAGVSSGITRWPDFSTCMFRMLVGVSG